MLRRDVFSCMCWWVCETSARSSAKSRSSSVDRRVHLMPRGWFSVVRRITQSITMLKNSADIEQPCLTPVLTSKLDLLFPMWSCRRSWMNWTICCGIPYAMRMRQRLYRWTLSKAFSKSTKSMCSCLCHSVHCSIMFFKVNTWSINPLRFRKPACSFLNRWSTSSEIRCPVFW